MTDEGEDMMSLAALSCTLPEGEARARRAELGRIFSAALNGSAIEDGVELEYAGDDDTARALLDFVLFERRCCADLRYELRFLPPHEAARLRITGTSKYVDPIRAWARVPLTPQTSSAGID